MKTIKLFVAVMMMGAVLVSCDDSKKKAEEEKMKMEQMEAEKKMEAEKMAKEAEMKREEMAVMVGGAKMYPDMTIVENASKANNLTTLVAAVKQAGLVETLNSDGPFTVFAPTDDAFNKVPEKNRMMLMEDKNKEKLGSILKYHVVSGKITAADLKKMTMEGKNMMTELTTINGQKLTVMEKDGKLMVKDAMGKTANIIVADVNQSNGVVHGVDTVLMPK